MVQAHLGHAVRGKVGGVSREVFILLQFLLYEGVGGEAVGQAQARAIVSFGM